MNVDEPEVQCQSGHICRYQCIAEELSHIWETGSASY